MGPSICKWACSKCGVRAMKAWSCATSGSVKAATVRAANSAHMAPVDGVDGRRELAVSDAGEDGHGDGGREAVVGGDGDVNDITIGRW